MTHRAEPRARWPNSAVSGSTSAPDCGDSCPPCNEGERGYECAPICVCEAIDDAARDEQVQLLTCDWEQPCTAASLEYTANAGSPIYQIHGAECLFSALRDRTAGRFGLTYTDHTGFWVDQREYVFVLDGSDRMLVLSSRFSGGPGENVQRGFGVESCALAEFSNSINASPTQKVAPKSSTGSAAA